MEKGNHQLTTWEKQLPSVGRKRGKKIIKLPFFNISILQIAALLFLCVSTSIAQKGIPASLRLHDGDPVVVFKQYTLFPEQLLNLLGLTFNDVKYSTSEGIEMTKELTKLFEDYGISGSLFPESLSGSDRKDCEDTYKSYGFSIYGKIYSMVFDFNPDLDSVTVVFSQKLDVYGSETTWKHYTHTWSKDFFYCLFHTRKCPPLLGRSSFPCEEVKGCKGTYCVTSTGSLYYYADPLVLEYRFGATKGTKNVFSWDLGRIIYPDPLTGLLSAVAGADNNPFAIYGGLFKTLIDKFSITNIQSDYSVQLPFYVLPDEPFDNTLVYTQPFSVGLEENYWELQSSVSYSVSLGTAHYGMAESCTLDGSKTYGFGMSVPDYLPNTLLLAAYEAGLIGTPSGPIVVSTDDYRTLFPELPSSASMELNVSIPTFPHVDFTSASHPTLVYEDLTVDLRIGGTAIATIHGAVTIPFSVSVSESTDVFLIPNFTDAIATIFSKSTEGVLRSVDDEEISKGFIGILKKTTFEEGLPLLKHAFGYETLINPGEELYEITPSGGWLNLYFK